MKKRNEENRNTSEKSLKHIISILNLNLKKKSKNKNLETIHFNLEIHFSINF